MLSKFHAADAVLLVIDIQGKLAYQMHDHLRLFDKINGLISAAHILNIPIVVTEQVPEKIGVTIPEISSSLVNSTVLTKSTFSSYLDENIKKVIDHLSRKQIIVCGIETHVCVIQTVRDLLNHQYHIQVIADAVASKNIMDWQVALERMHQWNIDISTTEMLLTEILESSNHPDFKSILNLIKR